MDDAGQPAALIRFDGKHHSVGVKRGVGVLQQLENRGLLEELLEDVLQNSGAKDKLKSEFGEGPAPSAAEPASDSGDSASDSGDSPSDSDDPSPDSE